MKRRKWQTFVRPFFVYFNVHTRTPWHTLSKTELIELIDLVLHVINGWRMCIWRATYITLQRASERDGQNEVEIEGARDIPSPHSIWRSILLWCALCRERLRGCSILPWHTDTLTPSPCTKHTTAAPSIKTIQLNLRRLHTTIRMIFTISLEFLSKPAWKCGKSHEIHNIVQFRLSRSMKSEIFRVQFNR